MNRHQLHHPEYVEGCFGCKVSSLAVGYCRSAAGFDATNQKKWDAELDSYEAARKQGIQPDGTTTPKIRAAEAWSQKNQMPYSHELAEKTTQLKALDRLLNHGVNQ